jgi:cholesterol transport system auxiliary component
MRIVLLFALLLLAGCSGLLPRPTPQQIFVPDPRIEPRSEWPQVTWQLQVAKPVAHRMLDSARIVVMPTPGEVQFYRGAAWADSAPEWLQSLIVHGFEDSGRIVGVGRQASGMRGDYLLLLDLRALQAEYRSTAGPPVAVFELGAKLVHPASNRVLASRRFRAEEAAESTAIPDVVRALERGIGAQLGELLRWVLVTGEANATSVGPTPNGR